MHTAKYGASIRKLVDSATKAKRARYECPKCRKLRVVRKGNAQWKCKSCDTLFAGGAYSFRTETGEIATRMVSEYTKVV